MSIDGSNFQQNNNLKVMGSITKDAITWGAVGGVIGAGVNLIGQRKILKNPKMLAGNIAGITDTLLIKDLKPSKRKFLSHALECLKKGKINYKSTAKTALNHGLWWAVPTLILNTVIFAGKSGYDSIKKNN